MRSSRDLLDKTHCVDDGSESLLEWVCGLLHVNIEVTKNMNIICHEHKVR
jgi:hypothetical protein